MEELRDHFEMQHEFKDFLAFKLKPRKTPQTTRSKRRCSTEAEVPIAKRRRGKDCLPSPELPVEWKKDEDDSFTHWHFLGTSMMRQTSAVDNGMRFGSPSGASSSGLEMLPHQVMEEICPSQSTATTLSSASSPRWPGLSASLSPADHSNAICETFAASPGPSWSTPDDLSDMALFTEPEQAISSQDSISNFSELLDTSYNFDQEPPGSPQSLLSFSELLAMPLSPQRDDNDSPATHPHTVIDLTSPLLSPLDELLSSGKKNSELKVLQQTPKIRPAPSVAKLPDSCPECQTKLPGPLPAGLLIRERIERCEVCNQKKVERAQTQWAQRGYPEINWSDLSDRVERYIPWLTECLEKRDVPLFREEYTKVRSRFEHEDFLITNPRSGYYGPRGEDIM